MSSPARLAAVRPEATAVALSPRGDNCLTHLLNDRSAQDYERAMIEVISSVANTFAARRSAFTGAKPEALRTSVAAIDLDQPVASLSAALDELDEVYLKDAVCFHHPRYLAHLNCPVVIPAVVADSVASAMNSSLDTWDQSAGGTMIERRLIDWTAQRLGFGQAADGIFTSGGTQSNLHALYLAREHALARHTTSLEHRSEVLPRLRILTSADSHFSVRTAAKLMGLHPDAVVVVPVDSGRRISLATLEILLDDALANDLVPMAVVATAGTTDFGVIDPLIEIADVCAERGGLWMHVDAAYGGGLLTSTTRRELLAGIERAHSATVDFHKSFFQPVAASAIVVREGAWMGYGTHYADYLNPLRMKHEGIPNQVDKSLQTTRRFDALKLWITLRVMGADAVGDLFDNVIDKATTAWLMIAEDERFEVGPRSDLSTVTFRFSRQEFDSAQLDAANLYARRALSDAGEALIASTTVDGATWLKFTLLNPRTSQSDIAEVIDLIAGYCTDALSTGAAG